MHLPSTFDCFKQTLEQRYMQMLGAKERKYVCVYVCVLCKD